MKYGLPVFSPLGRREDIMRSRPVGDPVIEEINFALDQLEATGPISTSPISTGPPEAAGAQSGPAGELEMVLIVHRHGARFPTKKLKGDLSWPASAQFWEDFAAQLTPTGALQLAQLGRWLAKRYAGLFAGVASEEVNEVVKVHTSNYQRTLFSAWSLLNGMFPQVPRYFNYLSERQGVDMTALDASMEAQGVNLGIAINIESNDEDDYLFHQIKAETTPEWVRDFEDGDNVNKDPEFHRMSQDPAYIALCQKLYKITGKKKLNHPKKRMTKLKSIFTQIEIARTHNLPILPNKDCEMVTPHELEMIEQAARSYIKHMFRPADSNKISDGIGEHSAGYLGNEIARVIEERIDGKHSLKFIEYSCHDSTCLALASLLGLDIEPPGFTGHFLIELYRMPGGQYSASVVWNGNPPEMSEEEFLEAQGRSLPLDGLYHEYAALPEGRTDIKALTDHLTIEGMKQSALILRNIHQFATSQQAGGLSKAESFKERAREHRSSFSAAEKEMYHEAFMFYDENQDATISATELDTAFRRFGLENITHTDVQAVLSCMDKDADSALSFEDFLVLMSFFKPKPEAAAGKPSRHEDTPPSSDEDEP